MDPLLFANIGANIPDPVLLGGLGLLAGMGGYLAVSVGTKVENIKREIIQLSNIATAEGLNVTSELLTDLAVEDLSGLVVHIRNIVSRLRDPGSRREVFMPFLKTQFVKWAKGENGRNPQEMKAFLEDALGVNITITPKPTPPQTP